MGEQVNICKSFRKDFIDGFISGADFFPSVVAGCYDIIYHERLTEDEMANMTFGIRAFYNHYKMHKNRTGTLSHRSAYGIGLILGLYFCNYYSLFVPAIIMTTSDIINLKTERKKKRKSLIS